MFQLYMREYGSGLNGYCIWVLGVQEQCALSVLDAVSLNRQGSETMCRGTDFSVIRGQVPVVLGVGTYCQTVSGSISRCLCCVLVYLNVSDGLRVVTETLSLMS